MAHIWPMYDLHMAHIAFRSAIRSAQRTDHQGTLGEKKGDLSPSLTVSRPNIGICSDSMIFELFSLAIVCHFLSFDGGQRGHG